MVKKITILSVLTPFLSKPGEALHLAQISKELREPHPTVRLALNDLEEKGVLRKSFKGRLTLYSLNKEHPCIIDYLLIAEKYLLIKRCEEDLLLGELIGSIMRTTEEESSALVFGSATGSLKKAKDIDVLITGKIDEKETLKSLKKFNKEIHMISLPKLSEVSPALKEEIIKKHLLIKNSESIMRWMLW